MAKPAPKTKPRKNVDLEETLSDQVGEIAETGHPTEVEPDSADILGVVQEDAISTEEALEGRDDPVGDGETVPDEGDGAHNYTDPPLEGEDGEEKDENT